MPLESLYLSDLLTGLLAALALQKVSGLSIRRNRFDKALAKLVDTDLTDAANKHGLAVKFRVRPHEIHGDSAVVQRALYEAAQRDLIAFENPEFQDIQLKIGASDAGSYFRGLPGTQDMYAALGSKLLQYYREVAA